MAKEACGGRDFTVVTMGIHGEKWKRKKNILLRRKGQRQGSGGMKKEEGEKKTRKTNELGVGWFLVPKGKSATLQLE